MCHCSPTVLTHRFCGRVLNLPDLKPRADGRRTEGRTTRCAHPAWLKKEPHPSTVDEKTGAWLELHARELDPPAPRGWHPKVVALHFGLDFSQLDQLRDALKEQAAWVDASPEDERAQNWEFRYPVPFTLDAMKNTAAIAKQPGAIAVNGARAQAATHYPRVSHQIDSARVCLQHVMTTVDGLPAGTKAATFLQLAHLVEHAKTLLEVALHGLHHPPSESVGMNAHATTLPSGEPV